MMYRCSSPGADPGIRRGFLTCHTHFIETTLLIIHLMGRESGTRISILVRGGILGEVVLLGEVILLWGRLGGSSSVWGGEPPLDLSWECITRVKFGG